MKPSEAKKLIGKKIAAIDLGGCWEEDEHGGQRCFMHMHPTITLDDGTKLYFHVEEHPSGDGHSYGVEICWARKR